MQLTESYLRKIIKEELRKVVLNEGLSAVRARGNFKAVRASKLLELPAYAGEPSLLKDPDELLFIQMDKRSGNGDHIITWDSSGLQNFMSITKADETKL